MQDLPSRLDELARKAKAATPGPWTKDEMGMVWSAPIAGGCRMEPAPCRICDIRGWGHLQYRPDGEAMQEANGDLIAALNPQVAQALIAVAQATRAMAEKCGLQGNAADGWAYAPNLVTLSPVGEALDALAKAMEKT